MSVKSKRGFHVYDSLLMVDIQGFEPEKEIAVDPETGHEWNTTPVDGQGSANWLVEQYGLAGDISEADDPQGILYTDYDAPGWWFNVLIDSGELETLKAFVNSNDYTLGKVQEITEPTAYGDGNGTIDIVKHADGWIVLE